MEVKYANDKLRKVCEDAAQARKKHGQQMAEEIQDCIDSLRAAPSAGMLVQFHIHRCHPLVGGRKGEYAMDLVHPYRLVFTEEDSVIKIARVQEIVDYH